MSLQTDEALGGYRIIERIGKGGMATVYKADQPRLGRHVALKVMHATIAQDDGFLARFEREARIVARLDHPNIVPIYDYDDADGKPYLVMKYVEGGTLKELLSADLPPLEHIADLIAPVADALTYAHQQGILHRDIKPSNILLDERGTPYLTDFGLARMVQGSVSTMSADVMLGTPHYISPEQAQGNADLDARTDVYSLGVVLYEMCTGRPPFVGDTSYAIIHDQIYTAPPPPRQLNPALSADVEAVLLKALAKDRNARYDTPQALADDFRRAIRGEQVSVPPRFAKSGDAVSDSMVTPRKKKSHLPAPPVPPKPPKLARPPKPPKPPRLGPLDDVRDSLREAGQDVRDGLNEARDEVRKAFSEISGYRWNWRPGTSWQTAPDGTQGFFTDEEIERLEEEAMADLTPEERLRKKIEKRIDERNEFFGHLGIYLAVNSFLWMIWFLTGGGFPWPLFPMGGWGIGLIIHGMEYYNAHGGGRRRREQQIEREMRRELERMGYKPKRDHDHIDYDNVRLTEDGEISQGFIDDYFEPDDERKRR